MERTGACLMETAGVAGRIRCAGRWATCCAWWTRCTACFGLTYKLALSTRPTTFLGSLDVWDRAEAALTEALNATGLPWEVRLPAFQYPIS